MTVMTNSFERTGANLHGVSLGGIRNLIAAMSWAIMLTLSGTTCVKSLKLVDMRAIDAQTMGRMFTKMKVSVE